MLKDWIKDLTKFGDRWIDDVSTVKLSDVPDRLYHYTDSAGLAGMLSTGEIWLTDCRFLNDKTEGVHLFQVAKENVGKRQGAKNKEKTALYSAMLENLSEGSSWDNYIFSLSEKKDDLSQWRGYAREGKGFTIGFDGHALHSVSDGKDGAFNFSKIEYDQDSQDAIIGKILIELETRFFAAIKAYPNNYSEIISEISEHIYWILDNRSPFSKHNSFKSESEWRISKYLERTSSSKEVRVRPSGLSLIPYIALRPMGEKAKLPIKSIGIGPGFSEPDIVDAVRALGRQNDYDVEVYFADTPYRRP